MNDRVASADVLVVGSGAGGGTVAARLSEDPACRVVLIEAGPDFPKEARNPPSFYAGGAIIGGGGAGSGSPTPELDWDFRSEPLPNGRRLRLSRGRLMGGSTMTNGCVAVRAKRSDFDEWQAAGAVGWSWESLRPVYETVERELSVRTYPRERWLPVQELLGGACEELGFRWAESLNDEDAWDGVWGPWPCNRHLEVRQGSLNTYIRQARPRPNFAIVANALVDRLLLSKNRVTGVRYLDRDGNPHELHAERVVLAAGAYGSAPILLRSGIGPADELRSLGIDTIADLPVGRGLLDHPGVTFTASVDPEWALMGWPAFAAAARGTTNYWCIPMAPDEERGLVSFTFFLGLTDGIDGAVTLSGTDPRQAPKIDHGYWPLAESGAFEQIWADFQALLETSTMRAAHVSDLSTSTLSERLLTGMSTGAHPAGGCGIGSVVTPDLDVIGVDGLSVADASVFPKHVTNNPNLTIHVVGEIAAAHLRRDGAGGALSERARRTPAAPARTAAVAQMPRSGRHGRPR